MSVQMSSALGQTSVRPALGPAPPFARTRTKRRGSHTRPSSSRPPQGQGPPVHRKAVSTTPASNCVTRDNLISPARVSRTSIRRDAPRGRALPCTVIACDDTFNDRTGTYRNPSRRDRKRSVTSPCRCSSPTAACRSMMSSARSACPRYPRPDSPAPLVLG